MRECGLMFKDTEEAARGFYGKAPHQSHTQDNAISFIVQRPYIPTYPSNASFVGLYVVVAGVVSLTYSFHLLSCTYMPAI